MGALRVSKAAREDLREIGRYTQSKYGKAQRRRYLSALGARFQVVRDNPLISRERAEFTPPVRIYRYEQHVIVYTADDQGVLIIRILHDAMDIDEQLS